MDSIKLQRFEKEARSSGYKLDVLDVLFVLLSSTILLMMLLTTDERYLDFGDGNYLYISKRLAEGAVLYRDILAPHPPLLFAVGVILLRINSSLMPVRLFSIILGIATSFLTYMLSYKIFANKKVALVASAIYYMMPIHLTWGRGFEADCLMIIFSLLAFMCVISLSTKGMILASFFSVFALLTKYSFLPNLLFIVGYLYLRRKSLLKFYLIPLGILISSSFIYLTVYSSGMFFWSTYVVQTMSPFEDIDILQNMMVGFFSIEGPLLLASVLGMLGFIKSGKSLTDCLIGYTLVSFIPLALTLRCGTGLYILYGAEPFIAIFVAYFLSALVTSHMQGLLSRTNRHFSSNRRLWKGILIGFFTLTLLFNPMLDLCVGQFLNFSRYANWSNAPQARQIMAYVENYTCNEDFILSPPYFAFMTNRRLLFDYSETWLWRVAYEHGDARAIELVESLVTSLESNAVKLVILDFRTKSIGRIYRAISENYQLIYKATIIENFGSIHQVYAIDTIEVYIPKSQLPGSAEKKVYKEIL